MGSLRDVLVPDIGDFKNIPVIEVLVKPGDSVKAEDSLITLESDKGGQWKYRRRSRAVVKELKIKAGDKVSEGAGNPESGNQRGCSCAGLPRQQQPRPPQKPARPRASASRRAAPPPPAAAPAASKLLRPRRQLLRRLPRHACQ
jgi:pyruvate dehydrogenase E2 component (dihydrolipoamide acetyltransferase)